MQSDTVDNPDRLVRLLLAAALALVAVASFRKERRLVGVLAGVGALGVGYSAATRSTTPSEEEASQTVVTEPAEADGGMRCAACGEPIVVGESRRPNRENRIVHEGCL